MSHAAPALHTWLVVAWSWRALVGRVQGTVEAPTRGAARRLAGVRWPECGPDALLVVEARYARTEDLLVALAHDGTALLGAG